MPLLAHKVYWPKDESEERTGKFKIHFTNERFSTKDEYDSKLMSYKEAKWTAQSTGESSLTYEKALASERLFREKMAKIFPKGFWEPALSLIHHSSDSEDTIVTKLEDLAKSRFFGQDEVILSVPKKEEVMPGIIEAVTSSAGTEHSPTDKENANDLTYTLKLTGGSSPRKHVKKVPKKFLRRQKDFDIDDIRSFLKTFAHRPNSHLPWQIAKDMQQKYGIKDKVATVFLGNASPQTPKPQKARKSMPPKPSANPKGSNIDPTHVTSAKHSPIVMKPLSAEKKRLVSPTGPLRLPGTEHKTFGDSTSSSGDDDNEGCFVRRSSGVAPSSARAKKDSKKAPKVSPTKAPVVVDLTEDTSNGPWSLASPSKSVSVSAAKRKVALATNQVRRSISTTSAGSSRSKSKSKSSKQGKTIAESFNSTMGKMKEKPISLAHGITLKLNGDDENGSPPKIPSPQRKQPSLPFQMTGAQREQKRIQATIEKLRLTRAKTDKKQYYINAALAARNLSLAQIESIPEDNIRGDVKIRHERVKEQEMIMRMTEEERQAFTKKKREEEMQKRQEAMKAYKLQRRKMEWEAKRKYEDQTLDSPPLPHPESVSIPDSIANELFGSAAMVSQFIGCYAGFLGDMATNITTDSLLTAVSSGQEGFPVVAKVLEILLNPLLQDQVTKDYHCLDMKLSDFVLNEFSAPELARLLLRQHDEDLTGDSDSEDDSDSVAHFYRDTDSPLLERMENFEFFDLSSEDQLKIMETLVMRLLNSYGVNEWQEQKEADRATAYKERQEMIIERNREHSEKVKAEKENKMVVLKAESCEVVEKKPAVTMDNFCVDKSAEPSNDDEKEIGIDPEVVIKDSDDSTDDERARSLAETMKSRRKALTEEKETRKQQEKLERQQRKKEEEEAAKIDNREAIERKYWAAKRTSENVSRVVALGSDRNHNKYWLFGNSTPGLFIEKGWATSDIEYNCQPAELVAQNPSTLPVFQDIETTFPPVGQNLWFCYLSAEQIDDLLNALNAKGIRESKLKDAIKKRYDEIKENVALVKSQSNGETKVDASKYDLLRELKDELKKTELQVRDGGLGGVSDFVSWTDRLEEATTVEQVSKCILETYNSVFPRFLTKILRPKKTEQNDESSESRPNSVVPKSVQKWLDAVNNSTTFGRLYILLCVLDSCIDWDESVAIKKCGICRKSKNDDQLLLCDDCNGAFHTFCLRPPLKRIPAGDWFCPKCSQERAPKTRSLRTFRESSDDDESDEEEDEDRKKRKTRSKQKAGKAKSKRQRIKSSSDESSDEKQKAPTKKKQKRQMAGTDESAKSLEKQLASATPKVKVHLKCTPTSTPNASSDETKTVSERCQHYLDKMYHSRLVTSLDSLPKAVATTRSRAHAEKSLDLNAIKEKLPTYKTVRHFFKDLKAMVAHAKDVFQDKPRKLTQLDDLQTLITEMESARNA